MRTTIRLPDDLSRDVQRRLVGSDTGLLVSISGPPVTTEDVRSLEDE